MHRTRFTSRTPLTPAGANVVADATTGVVALSALEEADEPDVDEEAGAVPHGATVVVAHDAVSKFLMRPNSLWTS